jgi:hypothetical protein
MCGSNFCAHTNDGAEADLLELRLGRKALFVLEQFHILVIY